MLIRKPHKIAAARRARRDRQADLARRLHVSQQYISRIETGKEPNCSRQFARQLSRDLGLDLADVFLDDQLAARRVRQQDPRRRLPRPPARRAS
jgi:transcriptional regulator with XRE-family HTH domain